MAWTICSHPSLSSGTRSTSNFPTIQTEMIREGKFVCLGASRAPWLPQPTENPSNQILSLLYSTHPGWITSQHICTYHSSTTIVIHLLIGPLASGLPVTILVLTHGGPGDAIKLEVRLFRSVQVGFHLVQREHKVLTQHSVQCSAMSALDPLL